MSTPTEIYFPDNLPYPFKILSFTARVSDTIQEGQRLLNYSFLHIPGGNIKQAETRFGSWDATFAGELHAWKVKIGDLVIKQKAKDKPALLITEACKHGIQVNGLCALCGMDMANFDYTGRPESSRATIQMTHSASGPTVSLEEAQRIERETAKHLLESRKLSLIVDLDQTIVHATVDPTVGEWIAEGEAWEAKQARREQRKDKKKDEDEEDDSDDSDDDSDEDDDEEVNPNWEALKDVKKFRLAPDVFGGPGYQAPWKNKGKERAIENDGCLYYVKPRPGWREFLNAVAQKYEMHVYTMGTRAYAEEVCAAIDPDGRIFGGRILSRDESGSLTQKSLRRLFPCDTSMVVIIDDRADVWEWSPNLLKVIPYDFYVGIGDINSTFLPKVDPLSPVNVPPRLTPMIQIDDNPPGSDEPPTVPLITVTSPLAVQSLLPTESEDGPNDTVTVDNKLTTASAKNALITQNTLALEAQVEERPLAKKQEELSHDQPNNPDPINLSKPGENGAQNHKPEDVGKTTGRKALLKNDDTELVRVGKLLDDVHNRFFEAYDTRPPETENHRRSRHHKSQEPEFAHDVRLIIPQLRMSTFAGVHILFSGVIPTNSKMEHENTEIWRMARAFGATCHRDLSKHITHVVTSKRGTHKVEMAQKQRGLFIVWVSWFTDSIARWQRQDERQYLLDDVESINPAAALASSPPSDPTAISTDDDPEGTVDEEDGDVGDAESKAGATASADAGDVSGQALDLGDVDWQNVHDEVEAAMMESDSDDESTGGRTSTNVSDDEGSLTDSPNNSPRRTQPSRKRLRSVTPSEIRGMADGDDDSLKSPLAKRKKLAADRTGPSKLKEAISASDLHAAAIPVTTAKVAPDSSIEAVEVNNDDDGDDDDDDDDESEEGGDDDEDDFLARELEEEWG